MAEIVRYSYAPFIGVKKETYIEDGIYSKCITSTLDGEILVEEKIDEGILKDMSYYLSDSVEDAIVREKTELKAMLIEQFGTSLFYIKDTFLVFARYVKSVLDYNYYKIKGFK